MFEWETKSERLKKFMNIPPQVKLEWLHSMHEMVVKSCSKNELKLRFKLRFKDK